MEQEGWPLSSVAARHGALGGSWRRRGDRRLVDQIASHAPRYAKFGRHVRYPLEDVLKWEAEHMIGPTRERGLVGYPRWGGRAPESAVPPRCAVSARG
jgi:hypothetical protein